MSIIGGLGLGLMLEFGVSGVIICGAIYAESSHGSLPQRHYWAWITLTIVSFNPIVWIINSIYLWKRWTEGSANMATVLTTTAGAREIPTFS